MWLVVVLLAADGAGVGTFIGDGWAALVAAPAACGSPVVALVTDVFVAAVPAESPCTAIEISLRTPTIPLECNVHLQSLSGP